MLLCFTGNCMGLLLPQRLQPHSEMRERKQTLLSGASYCWIWANIRQHASLRRIKATHSITRQGEGKVAKLETHWAHCSPVSRPNFNRPRGCKTQVKNNNSLYVKAWWRDFFWQLLFHASSELTGFLHSHTSRSLTSPIHPQVGCMQSGIYSSWHMGLAKAFPSCQQQRRAGTVCVEEGQRNKQQAMEFCSRLPGLQLFTDPLLSYHCLGKNTQN